MCSAERKFAMIYISKTDNTCEYNVHLIIVSIVIILYIVIILQFWCLILSILIGIEQNMYFDCGH
jgi:hypothetical protein